jgi:hypothetical protein
MKRLASTLYTLVITSILLTGCTKDSLTGEGSVVTKSRSLSAFTSVDISGMRYAEIIYSDKSMVEITGYENLVPVFESNVKNGSLSFKYPNFTKVKNDNIKLKIYTPVLNKIRLSGSTEVVIGDGFEGQSFEANLSGLSKLSIENSQYEFFDVFSSGNSKVLAKDFIANRIKVDISGNGYLEVNAISELAIKISGNGEVHYWGNPAVSTKISGSGKAVKH